MKTGREHAVDSLILGVEGATRPEMASGQLEKAYKKVLFPLLLHSLRGRQGSEAGMLLSC